MGLFDKPKTLEEIEEETEQAEAEDRKATVELSRDQKLYAIKRLKERGLTAKHFGFDYQKIWQWLKTH